MPKRVLEAVTQEERAKQRRKLGTLKELTVQPSTRIRYNKAIDGFLQFLKFNGLQLPRDRELLDPLLCEYLEHLWSSGQGRALASDTVAGLQDHDAKLRGHLQGSWRLLKTWSLNEIPSRAPPLPPMCFTPWWAGPCSMVIFHLLYLCCWDFMACCGQVKF